MDIHITCLTADGGLPIFTRRNGNCENLPFSTIASLNGVHMFFKSLGIRMSITSSENWTIVWKDYEDVITLIICGKHVNKSKMEHICDLIFNSFKLFVHSEDFKNSSKNIDRLKREAKQYIPIIDRLLNSAQNDIPGFSECIVSPEYSHYLSRLNEFSHQCDSLFCCIVVNQKIAVGTEGWWDLDLIDRKILLMLLCSSSCSQLDVAVYLPKRSVNTAYRFVTVPIVGCGILCVICGAEPSHQEIRKIGQNVFKNDINSDINTNTNLDRCATKSFSEALYIDKNILKIILLNKATKRHVFYRNAKSPTIQKYCSELYRLDYVWPYVDQVIENCMAPIEERSITKYVSQYWCSDYHKCYAYCDENDNAVIVLFTASVPTFAMKQITENALVIISREQNK